MGRRIAYMVLGMGIGLLGALVLTSVMGKHLGTGDMVAVITGGSIAVGIAERRGKVKSVEELNRPLTLFPPSSPKKSPK